MDCTMACDFYMLSCMCVYLCDNGYMFVWKVYVHTCECACACVRAHTLLKDTNILYKITTELKMCYCVGKVINQIIK